MNSPLVSIVVPSFQQGEFLGHCLDSVLLQSYQKREVLLYDAGSTDITLEVIEQYQDRIVTRVERDLGQAHALNKGFRSARGEIFGYLNSDDVLLPGALERIVDCFLRNPDAEIVYGEAYYINRKGDVTGRYLTREWDEDFITKQCFLCQPSVFWRRRLMEKIGLFDEYLDCSMDYDYWLRAMLSGARFVKIDEYLAASRDYPETKTKRDRSKVFFENFRLLNRRLGYVPSKWIEGYIHHLKIEKYPRFGKFLPEIGKSRRRLSKCIETLSRFYSKDVYFVDDRKYLKIL